MSKGKRVMNGTMWVQAQYSNEPEENHEVIVETLAFGEGVGVAQVSVQEGRTTNLGNYESRKVSVLVSLPCVVSEVPAALAKAETLVEAHLNRMLGLGPSGREPTDETEEAPEPEEEPEEPPAYEDGPDFWAGRE
jgi:hypothetical protein